MGSAGPGTWVALWRVADSSPEGGPVSPWMETNADMERRRYVGKALIGEPIGLVQHTEHAWDIHFGLLHIGILNERTQRTDKTPVVQPSAGGV